MPQAYKPLPTQERLHQLFEYSVVTGHLRWKVGPYAGKLTSTRLHPNGYFRVNVDKEGFLAHRIIWKLITGQEPSNVDIDHIDGVRNNNSWHNLRLASRSQNLSNCKRHRDNSSGYKGVHWDKKNRLWVASIYVRGVYHFLGRYASAGQAHNAYVEAANNLNGEYARAA